MQDFINTRLDGLQNKWFSIIVVGAIIYAIILLLLGLFFIGKWAVKISRFYNAPEIKSKSEQLNEVIKKANTVYDMYVDPINLSSVTEYKFIVDTSGVKDNLDDDLIKMSQLYVNARDTNLLTKADEYYKQSIPIYIKIYNKVMYIHIKNLIKLSGIINNNNYCSLISVDWSKFNKLTNEDISDMMNGIGTQAGSICANAATNNLRSRYWVMVETRKAQFISNGYSFNNVKPNMENPSQAAAAYRTLDGITNTGDQYLDSIYNNYSNIVNYFKNNNTYDRFKNPVLPVKDGDEVSDTNPRGEGVIQRLIGLLLILYIFEDAFRYRELYQRETDATKKTNNANECKYRIKDVQKVLDDFNGIDIDLKSDGNSTFTLDLTLGVNRPNKTESFINYGGDITNEEMHYIELEM